MLLRLLSVLLCLLPMAIFSQNAKQDERSHIILVSVAPHKFFVEKIAGNTVKVNLMVPAGASSHTYEPTPRQMLEASNADAWFQIGEGFEPRAARGLKSHNPRLQLIDLRQGVHLISSDPDHAHHHQGCTNPNCQDMHFWLSAREGKSQAAAIARTLSMLYPENKKLYEENLRKFQSELDDLDREIQSILKNKKSPVIMVSHPAYAYFARDYGLKQISIEFEGRDPTPQQLTRVIQQAKQARVKTIFVQMQYNNKGARLIADQIGARVVNLDPYSENYIEAMREIARAFAAGD